MSKPLDVHTLRTLARRYIRGAKQIEANPAYFSDLVGQRESLRAYAAALDNAGRALLDEARTITKRSKRA